MFPNVPSERSMLMPSGYPAVTFLKEPKLPVIPCVAEISPDAVRVSEVTRLVKEPVAPVIPVGANICRSKVLIPVQLLLVPRTFPDVLYVESAYNLVISWFDALGVASQVGNVPNVVFPEIDSELKEPVAPVIPVGAIICLLKVLLPFHILSEPRIFPEEYVSSAYFLVIS
jgi:hypothetical protein